MAISEMLQTAYASSPLGEIIFRTLEVESEGMQSIRLVHGYDDMVLGGQLFEACQMSMGLPEKNTTGNQSLRFGVGLVDSRAHKAVRAAQENGAVVYLLYREFLSSNLAAPARRMLRMEVVGGEFADGVLQVEASYFDMLNFAWPRDWYTALNAPGLKYL